MVFSESKLLSDNRIHKLPDRIFLFLATAAVIASAFGFWPFEDSKTWQMLNVANLCCLIGLAIVSFLLLSNKSRRQAHSFMPHVSITAYWCVNVLSIGFADNLSRPANYTIKLALVFLGGFYIFQRALSSKKAVKIIYQFIITAVLISIFSCIYTRLTGEEGRFGFHGNVLKYGTYIGILVPLCSIYLLSGSKYQAILGIFIALSAVFSAGSVGGVLAILAGLITGLLLMKKRSAKVNIFICILLSIAALLLSNKVFNNPIRQDFALKEKDGVNLRQRYIEWQAEINLLEKRGITGTGAGCINDYRSNFYYRLPKLNTLKAFDQNGFLAVAAETGLISLVIFCWIVIHYGSLAFKNCLRFQKTENSYTVRIAAANAASFVSVLIANVFSSVHYNGILVVFVLLLCLISSVNRIYGERSGEA